MGFHICDDVVEVGRMAVRKDGIGAVVGGPDGRLAAHRVERAPRGKRLDAAIDAGEEHAGDGEHERRGERERNPSAEAGRWKTEDRRWKMEDGRLMPEVGNPPMCL